MPAAERRELIASVATGVFAERGYDGASIDEIARRAGVSAPVVYDHFASKQDLYEQIVERTRDALLARLARAPRLGRAGRGADPARDRGLGGWVEEHRDASRMYFRDATALPEPVRSFHLGIHAQGRVALGAILGREQGAANIAGPGAEALEMAAEIMRAGLGGLAIWWAEHPDVPREQVVDGRRQRALGRLRAGQFSSRSTRVAVTPARTASSCAAKARPSRSATAEANVHSSTAIVPASGP